MKAVDFPEANKTLAKPHGMSHEECMPLRVFSDGQYCISLWRPTLRERLSILFRGRIWLWVLSGYTQPPVAVEAYESPFIEQSGG